MKSITAVLFSLLLLISTAAMAEKYPPTRTYEVSAQSVRMPDSSNGTITVKECDECDYETYRVNERTVYEMNGKSMRFEDFLLVIEKLRQDGDHAVNVRRDLQTNTITKVFVYTQ